MVQRKNRVYLNNGTTDPWEGVKGLQLTADEFVTWSLGVGDLDRDGDLDVAVANSFFDFNEIYLTNGSQQVAWAGAIGVDTTADVSDTRAVAAGDVDQDGDLDLVEGLFGQPNRLYRTTGPLIPWSEATGTDITTDAGQTLAVVLGDLDRDGDLDLVAGNAGVNRLYLGSGTADPWGAAAGIDITADVDTTRALALGDVDRDGDLDLIAGNDASQQNRLYLNNGTADPFNGVAGVDVTNDNDRTTSLALADVDDDGDLDLIAGNDASQRNRLYLNNGTSSPFAGVAGSNISTDRDSTRRRGGCRCRPRRRS